jgi:alkylation response protein AidB-like acyl-CoA dehydrogenase
MLLRAGVALGIARAAFADMLADKAAPVAGLGRQAIQIEATAATLERAGRKLDIAQVNPTEPAMQDAYFSASAAYAFARQAALAAADALFELSDAKSASIALNLDRHWRNARIHALPVATDTLHRAAGDYFLKRNDR